MPIYKHHMRMTLIIYLCIVSLIFTSKSPLNVGRLWLYDFFDFHHFKPHTMRFHDLEKIQTQKMVDNLSQTRIERQKGRKNPPIFFMDPTRHLIGFLKTWNKHSLFLFHVFLGILLYPIWGQMRRRKL